MIEKLTDDLELYSDLLLSVGTHAKDRPLLPIEVSDLIYRLKDEEQESTEQISKRLGLGKKIKITTIDKKTDVTQVNQFLKLQDLSKKSKKILGWGRSDLFKIPFTIGSIIASLPDQNDQDLVLQTALQMAQSDKKLEKFNKNDAIRIVDIKIKSPKKSISDVLQEVKKIKAIEIVTYMVSSVLEKKLLTDLKIDCKKYKIDINQKIKNILQNKLNDGKILAISLKENTLFVSMDEKGYDNFEEQRKMKKIPFTKFVNLVTREGISNV